jgi:hypothetical protein
MHNSAHVLSGTAGARPLQKLDIIVVLLLVVLCVFEVATVQTIESPRTDSAVYMTLAHNIRETGRYEFNYRPHTVYPPGFPLLLVGISSVTGQEGYDVYIRFMPVFGTLALIVWYFVLRRHAGRLAAAICCVLVATSDYCFSLATQSVLSDTPFFLLSGVAILCFNGLASRAHSPTFRFLLVAGFVTATVSTVLIRSAGVALCAALVMWAITGRRYHDSQRSGLQRIVTVAAIVGLAGFSGWIAWTKHSEVREYEGQQMRSYASLFTARDPHRPELGTASTGDFIRRAAANIPLQASQIAALALRAGYIVPTWYSPVAVMVLGLLAAGLGSYFSSTRRSLLPWYFLAYFAIYSLWPFDEGLRFMLPVAPLAFALMWDGVIVSARSLQTRPVATLGTILALAVCTTVATGFIDRPPGLQAKAAVVFWPLLAIAAGSLLLILKSRWRTTAEGALRAMFAFVSSRRAQYGMLAVGAGLVFVGLVQQAAIARSNVSPDPTSFRHFSSADFASWLHGAGDGVVMAEQVEIVHRLSARRVMAFPITSDPNIILTSVRREHVRFVMVSDPMEYPYFYPTEDERWRLVEAAEPSLFQLVHRGPGYRIYESSSYH